MPRLIRGVARTAVIAGTATAVSNRVSRRQAGRWAAQDEQAYSQQQYGEQYSSPQYAPPPAAPAGVSNAELAQLKELAGMRDQGILSEAEFQEQKARLLRS
jgi:hypothetical protein